MSSDELAERLRKLEVENALLSAQVVRLDRDLENMNSGIARGLWLIGGGFLAAFVTWVVNGGLKGG
jgi:hypothetical protein